MSTKTSIKRIAAVAAVALTLGGFSAVSAHAAPSADSLTVASTTGTGTVGVAAKVAVTQTFIANVSTDTSRVIAALISAPAGSAVTPTWDSSTVSGYTNANVASYAVSGGTITTTPTAYAPTYTAGTVRLSLTADKAGTYVVKLLPYVGDSGTYTAGYAASQTVTFTITGKPEATSAATTLTISAAGAGQGNDTDGIAASKTATNANIATVAVVVANGSTSYALANGDVPAINATVSGPGLVSWDGTAFGKSVNSATAGNLSQTLYVRADGAAGVGTITFSYTNAAGSSVTLGTKALTFYGTASTLTATVTNAVISTAAAAAAAVGNPATPATPAYRAVKVVVTDSNGSPVYGAHVYMNSSDTSIISGAYTDGDATSDVTGTVYFSLVGNKTGTASLSFTNRTSASDTTTEIVAGPVSVRVGKATASKVSFTFDKDSYAPGEQATVKVNIVDSTGLPVPNGVYTVFTKAATASLAIAAGTLPGTAVTGTASGTYAQATIAAGQVQTTDSLGNASFAINMPVTAGTVTFSATGDANLDVSQAGLTVSGSTTVTAGPAAEAAQAAIDAAQEATDAANAAYDAANNAMDSADAATAAAQDASDNAAAALAAVTSLSATVAKLVSSVSAIATALASIKKKLGVK